MREKKIFLRLNKFHSFLITPAPSQNKSLVKYISLLFQIHVSATEISKRREKFTVFYCCDQLVCTTGAV